MVLDQDHAATVPWVIIGIATWPLFHFMLKSFCPDAVICVCGSKKGKSNMCNILIEYIKQEVKV